MIDREALVQQVRRWMPPYEQAQDEDAEVIVDEVLIPELAKHEDQNLQLRIASAVDACGQSYQAAIRRQRDSITRLLEERKTLKERLYTLEHGGR